MKTWILWLYLAGNPYAAWKMDSEWQCRAWTLFPTLDLSCSEGSSKGRPEGYRFS